MTDEQIIKALECCADTEFSSCYECPVCPSDGSGCIERLCSYALALIKRQKAEIEKLIDECGSQSVLWRDNFASVYETAKETIEAEARAKAIREFAERMSTHIGLLEAKAEEDCAEMCRFLQNATIELHAKRSAYRDVRKCMSEIVKEMTEEQK